jgi:hypothetical protein
MLLATLPAAVAAHAVSHDHHGAGRVGVSVSEVRDQERIFLIVPSPVYLRS